MVRVSEEPFEIDGVSYDRGTLVITRKANEKLSLKLDTILRDLSKKHNTNMISVKSGMVSRGKDFGSSTMRVIKAPEVAVLSGEDVSSYNF